MCQACGVNVELVSGAHVAAAIELMRDELLAESDCRQPQQRGWRLRETTRPLEYEDSALKVLKCEMCSTQEITEFI